MKVLVIHDREDVTNEISTIILETVPHAEIDIAEDLFRSRSALQGSIFDLLIADLTIPHTKGNQSIGYQNAEQLFKELFILGSLNAPGDAIGMTNDAAALSLVSNSLGRHLMTVIEEDAAGEWRSLLKDKIRYAQRAADTRTIVSRQHYLYDALLLTAMDKEMAPYENMFEMEELPHFRGAKEFAFTDRNGDLRKGVAFSAGRSGQAAAASAAQALITQFRPRLALMTGYCGGVKEKVKFGDLIFFEAAFAWDYGKWVEEGEGSEKRAVFRARPSPLDTSDMRAHNVARAFKRSRFFESPGVLDRIRQLSRGKVAGIDIHLCPAASGSAVVTNEDIVSQIRGLSEAIWAVDMEAYGFYFAAKNTQVIRPEFMCMKAVSDFCNGEKGDDLHEVCSDISANAASELITKYWDF